MNAGRLRHRLLFLRAATTNDSRGGRSKAWRTWVVVPGELVALSGDEQDIAQRLATGVTHAITIRWSPRFENVPVKDLRIALAGVTFEVAELIDKDGRQRFLTGTAKKVSG